MTGFPHISVFYYLFSHRLFFPPPSDRKENEIHPKAFMHCYLLLFSLTTSFSPDCRCVKAHIHPSCAAVAALGIKVGNWWYLFFPNLSLPEGCFNRVWIFGFACFRKAPMFCLGHSELFPLLWFVLFFQRKLCLLVEEMLLLYWEHEEC